MSKSPIDIDTILEEQRRGTQMLLRRDRELTRVNEKLQALDREKSEFVSIAAHQLRTPLSAIRWAQQMLIDGDVGDINPQQQQLLAQSQESIYRMIQLVNDLLSVDHLEYGQVVYDMKKFNIAQMVHEVVEELRPMALERKIAFTFIPPERQMTVYGDVNKLKEAMANIIGNALKYTLVGGEVVVSVQPQGDEAHIVCKDNGIGVPESEKDRLFKKFSRADNAKKIDADGSGLGLFIVEKIVEAHNGTVAFDSVEGKGSTFTVALPVST